MSPFMWLRFHREMFCYEDINNVLQYVDYTNQPLTISQAGMMVT